MKKLIRDLGLPVENIDACKNGCMLYWKDDIDLNYCKFVEKLEATAEQKMWHANHETEERSMCHPYDVEAWRHFHLIYPNFAAKPHNVIMGCAWMVILGPSNLKCLIDVYLEPLIEELQNFWHVGVLTLDNAKNETFTMPDALMWTVNDLPAYEIRLDGVLLMLWVSSFYGRHMCILSVER
ncbi:UNVERIFIED_CONTAM: hypothetical protein Sangu_2727800 [Sesamum angustifolium]|uniref:Uncharacterized protein n=1 Tax=Sesamum angustifolium TaxID=2727405 RepID=A0AAW2IYT4_9LAMI